MMLILGLWRMAAAVERQEDGIGWVTVNWLILDVYNFWILRYTHGKSLSWKRTWLGDVPTQVFKEPKCIEQVWILEWRVCLCLLPNVYHHFHNLTGTEESSGSKFSSLFQLRLMWITYEKCVWLGIGRRQLAYSGLRCCQKEIWAFKSYVFTSRRY